MKEIYDVLYDLYKAEKDSETKEERRIQRDIMRRASECEFPSVSYIGFEKLGN